MNRDVFITDAKRTPVAPRGGAFSALSVDELCAPVIGKIREQATMDADVELVLVGNGLYGGGNPARLVALATGIPETVSAMTVDTQCCAGMDAISLAADAIRVGRASCVLAGGVESFSRSPVRLHRGLRPGDQNVRYDRPPFTPWPNRDPDMLAAAAELASAGEILRADQEDFAIGSHERARTASAADGFLDEIAPVADVSRDEFTRNLSLTLCARMPVLAGASPHGITAATTAVEADAAAFVMLRETPDETGATIRLRDSIAGGADPTLPGLAPIEVARQLLDRNGLAPDDLACVEIMEAFAAQAIAFINALDLPPSHVNVSGGALARGHPIGASGAILVVRLVHELRKLPEGSLGLGAIAGAGGLASCILVERV